MKLGHSIMPFAVGLNWLKVAFKCRFCDGRSVRTENFMERLSVFYHFAVGRSG